MTKRLVDIIVSSLLIIFLSPLMIVIVALLRMTGEGEIFFFQDRIGFHGKLFKITKFATMQKSAAKIIPGDFSYESDVRVLKVGKMLRKTKINELPQFWDVLRGEMSIVGPRPQLPVMYEMYPSEYKHVVARVRPGVTGLGSLVFRDEEKILSLSKDKNFCYTKLIIPYKAELEAWYAENNSLYLDISIILLTIWYIVFPKSKALWKIIPAELYRDLSKFPANIN
jgi:lipopolysaccharide/colanic/teichoic acid biosynthesis glycosyltransferase